MRCLSLSVPGRKGWLRITSEYWERIQLSGEGTNLNQHNKPLFTPTSLVTSQTGLPTLILFLFSRRWYLSPHSEPPQRVAHFSWAPSMYTAGTHVNKLLLVFLLLICLLLQGSQPRTQKGRGIFSSLTRAPPSKQGAVRIPTRMCGEAHGQHATSPTSTGQSKLLPLHLVGHCQVFKL